MFSTGHPGSAVPSVVFYVEVMVKDSWFPPGLRHRIFWVDFRWFGGGWVIPVGDDFIGGHLEHGFRGPLVQYFLSLT